MSLDFQSFKINSATSKNSKDSGISNGDNVSQTSNSDQGSLADDLNSSLSPITEQSAPETVEKVNQEKRPLTPDLSVNGRKVQEIPGLFLKIFYLDRFSDI